MLATFIKTTVLGLTIVAGTALVNPAHAQTKREPIHSSQVRETTAEVATYGHEVKIVRQRSKDKTFATFHADPQLIDINSVAVFEVTSYAKNSELSRWRCIATHDIAECLGSPVKIRYLPEDTHVELSFKLVPRTTREVQIAYVRL